MKCPEGQTRNTKTKQCRDKLKTGKRASPKNTTRKPSSRSRHSGETTSGYIARMAKKLNAQIASAERKIGSKTLKMPKTKKPSSKAKHSGETTSAYIVRMARKLNANINAAFSKKKAKNNAKSYKHKKD